MNANIDSIQEEGNDRSASLGYGMTEKEIDDRVRAYLFLRLRRACP
jgi:hypothetical protein